MGIMFIENRSLLPKNGQLTFHPNFIATEEADFYFEKLLKEIQWEQYYIQIFGKKIAQPRLTAWHGERKAAYSYSGINLMPLPFTTELLAIKQKVESFTGHTFNSVLLNLYRHNQDSMGWHSDDEKELGTDPYIASISLGCSRMFHLKHKTDKNLKGKLALSHGSLLCMGGEMQANWQHAIPKTTMCCKERINLTFRQIKEL